ncbi:response regulator [Zeimonas arvi]|uniref:Response regulator transcription factor n=1 Tax=Zeimonas arvi TaxID=2498847 RepID=A0A5C8NXR2_9BURK|nr:response regulator transcription factor [Zeimonas arvi]TXL65901.1 response regulator transcription factor [Zeimonas arvi]
MSVSALIIDDHPLIRDAVRMTLASLGPGGRIDMADSFASARRLLESGAEWDFALLDLSLPDCEGFEGLAAFRELRPTLPTIVLSGRTDRETILRCLDLGAAGYIPKTSQSDVISDALRLVASGHVYLPREALGRDFLREAPSRPGVSAGEPPSASGFAPSRAPAPPPVAASAGATLDPRKLGLTDRQCDVLRLILRGLPNKLICRQLDLAEGTVKVHVSAVLRALGVRNRTQAVIAASRMGLRNRLDASA